ncbi:serine hydrolase domain-containing protein [Microbulbifer sp. MCCC 1A16149]|uniref:serine hydrolase domain-containing protein n=1 Tax=Microbulbifer sp. MCCC 1A16149 TaxID=3411322 RepID=UPI003D12355A
MKREGAALSFSFPRLFKVAQDFTYALNRMIKRLVLYPTILVSLVLFVHFWLTQPLFWKSIPYRLQAYKLAFTQVECDPGAPDGLADLLKYQALPNFSLTGQVVYINRSGKRFSCSVVAEENGAVGRYRLASMTKAITAHAILSLANTEQLDLDSQLLSYFPEVDPGKLRDPKLKAVTLAELLNHSSGFGGPYGSDNMVKQGETPWCPHDFSRLESIRLAGVPGTNHVYSNVAYCLLGEVLARVTGVPYRDYIRSHYLDGTSLEFVDGGYLPDEPTYDFRNERRFEASYVDWLDFQALSPAAGLIGRPSEFADMVWEHLHGDAAEMLSAPLVPGCGKDLIERCYSMNFELVRDESSKVATGIQQGYLPGASSLLAITEKGEVLVWVSAGAPLLFDYKRQLNFAVRSFLASSSS